MRWTDSLWRSLSLLPFAGRGALDRLDIEEFAWRSKRAPDTLLSTLGETYGAPRYLDLNGKLHAASPRQLTIDRFGTDWLLVFGAG